MIAAYFAYPNGTIKQNDKSTVFHYLSKDLNQILQILFKQLSLIGASF